MEFTKEQLMALISEAGEWAEIYEHPIHDKPQRDFFEGMARAMTAYLALLTSSPAPVVPDGYVLVPIEPTEDMIVEGFESEPDESFSDEKEWEAYEAMSGCQQAAHRAKLCWAAMIAAVPKQENI